MDNDVGNGDLDDAAAEQVKSHINYMNGSPIDVDVLSALSDLKDLQLMNNAEIKDDQAVADAIKRRWTALLDD
jgi:hypothetical protein